MLVDLAASLVVLGPSLSALSLSLLPNAAALAWLSLPSPQQADARRLPDSRALAAAHAACRGSREHITSRERGG
jgi:hypothetical protein